MGDLSMGRIDKPNTEHKCSDFCNSQGLDLDRLCVLSDLLRYYEFWFVLTNSDGFQLDSLKYVTEEQALSFWEAQANTYVN